MASQSKAPEMTRPSEEAIVSKKLEEKMDEEVLRQLIKRLLEQDPVVRSWWPESAQCTGG